MVRENAQVPLAPLIVPELNPEAPMGNVDEHSSRLPLLEVTFRFAEMLTVFALSGGAGGHGQRLPRIRLRDCGFCRTGHDSPGSGKLGLTSELRSIGDTPEILQ